MKKLFFVCSAAVFAFTFNLNTNAAPQESDEQAATAACYELKKIYKPNKEDIVRKLTRISDNEKINLTDLTHLVKTKIHNALTAAKRETNKKESTTP